MPELLVGAALANFYESKSLKASDNFPWLENGNRAHTERLRDADGRRTDELCFRIGRAVLEKHADYFAEVLAQLVLRRALTMGTRKARHVPDEQSSVCVAFDNCGERMHA